MKQLFLSHYSAHAAEVAALARELRFHGVRPWVDKQGGFSIGDESASIAERAVREDCLGFLLYATEDVFEREFIRAHEVPHALKMRSQYEDYLLFAVPRNLGFDRLQELSQRAYGVDLSQYHTHLVDGEFACVQSTFGSIATDVVAKILRHVDLTSDRCLRIQFSTRELAPVEDDEVLTIDGTEAYAEQDSNDSFNALVRGLCNLKREVAARFGRPRLHVNGFKHLSSAFLFGRVFQPFDITVRQTSEEDWRLDASARSEPALEAVCSNSPDATELVVQISSRFKELTNAVDDVMVGYVFNRLVLRPGTAPLDVDERLCATMVRDAYSAIERMVADHPVQRVHLFAAAPQAFMMGLGKKFAGMNETLVYDYNGDAYGTPKAIPRGVL